MNTDPIWIRFRYLASTYGISLITLNDNLLFLDDTCYDVALSANSVFTKLTKNLYGFKQIFKLVYCRYYPRYILYSCDFLLAGTGNHGRTGLALVHSVVT